MEKKSSSLKPTIKMLIFKLRSLSNGCSATESRKVSSNGKVHHFSVDFKSIDKSDILNIQ